MRRRAPLAVLGAVAVALTAGCGANVADTPRGESLPGLTAKRLEILREWAIKTAAEMGESHATGGIIVATTQHHFFSQMPRGPILYGPDFKVFVVGMKGDFTAHGASSPGPGAPPPQGHFVYSVVHADTLDGSDWGIMDGPLDLSAYGPHVPLDLQSG